MGDCTFQGIYLFLLGCPIYCHIIVPSNALWFALWWIKTFCLFTYISFNSHWKDFHFFSLTLSINYGVACNFSFFFFFNFCFYLFGFSLSLFLMSLVMFKQIFKKWEMPLYNILLLPIVSILSIRFHKSLILYNWSFVSFDQHYSFSPKFSPWQTCNKCLFMSDFFHLL